MAENSGIQWTTHTFNPWRGCTEVSPGCANCYARTLANRNPRVLGTWGRDGSRIVAAPSQWAAVRRWNADASPRTSRGAGADDIPHALDHERPRVFCASLADVLEGRETMPADAWGPIEEARARLFELIDECENLDFLLLTKRVNNWRVCLANAYMEAKRLKLERAVRLIDRWFRGHAPRNVWFGCTVENQAAALQRVHALASIPARVHFLSCEPLLDRVDLTRIEHNAHTLDGYRYNALRGTLSGIITRDIIPTGAIQWVIVGGESGGSHVRAFNVEWAEKLLTDCTAAGVPIFVKQMGAVIHAPAGYFPDPKQARPWGEKGRVELKLVDNHGGDLTEWPEKLRVQQFPTVAA